MALGGSAVALEKKEKGLQLKDLPAALQKTVQGNLLVVAEAIPMSARHQRRVEMATASRTRCNNTCRRCERGNADFDVRHNFTTSVNAGGQRPSHLGRCVAPREYTLARTGLPLNVTLSSSASALPDGTNSNQRPHVAPGQPLYRGTKGPLCGSIRSPAGRTSLEKRLPSASGPRSASAPASSTSSTGRNPATRTSTGQPGAGHYLRPDH